ncbi:MAG: DUF177 domain-containing protein [Candidatus Omnitrophica bacterium]|nr:DUF177 domain-containing protein [Candidatus Omnitrophota bacterium]
MKIAVAKIKDKELEFTEEIDVKDWDMDSNDVKFVDNITLICKFLRVGKGIFVDATVNTHRMIVCSRCLEEVGQIVCQNFKLNYDINKLGDYLEIDDDVREEILLNFPMKVLCRPDCKGLCPKCGVNLNFEDCKCKRQT